MSTKRSHRTAASAFAAVALVAAGAGIAAVGSGAIAFGSGGAAIVTHSVGTRTVTLAANEIHAAATDRTYDEQVCSDPWLSPYATSCATSLQACAKKFQSSPATVVAVFTDQGRYLSCDKA